MPQVVNKSAFIQNISDAERESLLSLTIRRYARTKTTAVSSVWWMFKMDQLSFSEVSSSFNPDCCLLRSQTLSVKLHHSSVQTATWLAGCISWFSCCKADDLCLWGRDRMCHRTVTFVQKALICWTSLVKSISLVQTVITQSLLHFLCLRLWKLISCWNPLPRIAEQHLCPCATPEGSDSESPSVCSPRSPRRSAVALKEWQRCDPSSQPDPAAFTVVCRRFQPRSHQHFILGCKADSLCSKWMMCSPLALLFIIRSSQIERGWGGGPSGGAVSKTQWNICDGRRWRDNPGDTLALLNHPHTAAPPTPSNKQLFINCRESRRVWNQMFHPWSYTFRMQYLTYWCKYDNVDQPPPPENVPFHPAWTDKYLFTLLPNPNTKPMFDLQWVCCYM